MMPRRRARRRPRATTRCCSAPSATRRCPTTSRSGACCCRCARASTCGRTSAPRGCSTASRRSSTAARAVDMLFVRENTEGEYSGVGGRAHQGLELEVGHRDERLHARRRAPRRQARVRAGRGPARRRSRARRSRTRRATATCSGTRSPRRSRPSIPDVKLERVLVDALAARMVADPREPRRRRRVEPLRRRAHRHRRRAAGRHGHGGERVASRPARTRRASSSRCTARRPTSPARASRTRSARSGAPRSCSSTLGETEALGAADARARGRLPRRPAHGRHRRHRVDVRGRRRDRGARAWLDGGATRSSTRSTSAASPTRTATASATCPGITARLDYLRELGVDALWLTPFYPSPRRRPRLRRLGLRRRRPALRHARRLRRARGATPTSSGSG